MLFMRFKGFWHLLLSGLCPSAPGVGVVHAELSDVGEVQAQFSGVGVGPTEFSGVDVELTEGDTAGSWLEECHA